MTFRRFAPCLLSIMAALAPMSHAADFTFSGFANVTGGYVLSGEATPGQYPGGTTNPYVYAPLPANGQISYHCPCFVGNYEYAGIYEYRKLDFSPESSLGIQAQVALDSKLSATVQAVARGADNYKADIDWAYVSYKVADEWTIQGGHKRLPIYNYSDYMYVGYSYPWVRPPQDLYGWQIYSYNGVNVQRNLTSGDWSATINGWLGSQTDSDNRTLGLIYYGDTIHESWSKIVGVYADINYADEYELRLVTMTNRVDRTDTFNGVTNVDDASVAQRFFGASFNVDKKDWVIRTEANFFERPTTHDYYRIYLGSLGYHFTPAWGAYLTRSGFYETYPSGPEKHYTDSATVRWDLQRNADLKLQFDAIRDRSHFAFTGSANVVTLSFNATY